MARKEYFSLSKNDRKRRGRGRGKEKKKKEKREKKRKEKSPPRAESKRNLPMSVEYKVALNIILRMQSIVLHTYKSL